VEATLLDGLTDAHRREILAKARRRRFRTREIVFHEGDPAESVHLVLSGRFAARSTTPMGRVAIVGLFGPRGLFGELAMIDRETSRSATVYALEPGETLSLGREQFDDVRAANPSADRFLVDILATKVRDNSVVLVEALCERAEVRVLRRLVFAAEFWDALGPGGGTVALTQDDLSGFAGTTRPTVNKVLIEIERGGLIRTRRGRIDIVDPEGLRRRAAAF
jgi:CRP/FNR family transcriptional regulator, cyclic AMP receptor protein